MEMRKKYIAATLIPALLIQLYGCYSMQNISKNEMAGLKDGGDLIVYTKDSTIYFFEESNYHFLNDSLCGKGYSKFSYGSDFKLVNDNCISMIDIESVQQDALNPVKTWLLIGGVSLAVILGIILVFGNSESSETIVIPTN
jgi:hypothetical protein